MPMCESCGRDEREVIKVQRIYLVPAEEAEVPAPLEESVTATAGDIELWCASCCATFPHAPIEGDVDS